WKKKGLRRATLAFALLFGIMLIGIIPSNGFFRSPDNGLLNSPLIKGVVALLFIGAGLMGVVYGFTVKKFKSDADVMTGMGDSMKSLGMYYVLVFFAAQFVSYFKWSNLGIIFAIKGANLVTATGLGLIPLMILFIILSGLINMAMGSASAKWAIMAPVFIPMFMLLGYSPELSQVVYRIGDSVTNVISPMMSFFALIIAFIQKYEKNAGIGTVIATMLPYSIAFFIVWTALLVGWLWLGLPLGPNAGIFYNP
ncbi:MAG: AbgT family transporter, partial [Bacteroidetes bacterium]|nr:AbgT family transporter [Bacteroidota bacterium]